MIAQSITIVVPNNVNEPKPHDLRYRYIIYHLETIIEVLLESLWGGGRALQYQVLNNDMIKHMVPENQKVNRNLHALHSSKSTPLHT